jgi:hypothetical protein
LLFVNSVRVPPEVISLQLCDPRVVRE